MMRFNRAGLALLFCILVLAGCGGGGFPKPNNPPSNVSVRVSVNPSSIIIFAGSTTTFTVTTAPSPPKGGSLTWRVNPATGGTITGAGVYTAPATAGNYTVIATWTPSTPAAGPSASGSATVEVIPRPQLGAEFNSDLVQASGAVQVFGAIQNAAVVGQPVPSKTSSDSPTANFQIRHGFAIPVACRGSNPICP